MFLSFGLSPSPFCSLSPFFSLRSSPLQSCDLPCIYRKNRGERGKGGHCAAAPKIARGARSVLFSLPRGRPWVRGYTRGVVVGAFLIFFRERGREKSVKNSSSSPASHVQGKKKTHGAFQNDTVWVSSFLLFFFYNSGWNDAVFDKTHRFI